MRSRNDPGKHSEAGWTDGKNIATFVRLPHESKMTIQFSDTLLTLPMDRAHVGILDIAADGAALMLPARRLQAHLVTAGRATLHSAEQTFELVTGDYVMIARGIGYEIRCDPDAPAQTMPRSHATLREDSVQRYRIGRAPVVAASLLSAAVGLETNPRRILDGVIDPIIHLRGAHMALPSNVGQGQGEPGIEEHCTAPGGRALAAALHNLLYIHAVRQAYLDHADGRTFDLNLRRRHLGVEASLRLIQQHVDHAWTVASLASSVGMSRSAFALAFCRTTGEAPLAYITRVRLDKAAALLADADPRPIHDIAASVGYRSQAAFTRAFARRFGKPPRLYRGHN